MPGVRPCRVVPDFFFDVLYKNGVVVGGDEMRGIHKPVRAVANAHFVRQRGPECHFDALQCVQHSQAQLAVENVEIKDVVEVRAGVKAMRAIGVIMHLKDQRIAGKPVIPDEAQVMPGACFIRDVQPARTQQSDLRVYIYSWFGEHYGGN